MESHVLSAPSVLFHEVQGGRSSINLRRKNIWYRPGDILNLIEVTPEGLHPGNRICRKITGIENSGEYFTITLGGIEEQEQPRRTRWQ